MPKINTNVPALEMRGTTAIYHFSQMNTETLERWLTAIVAHDPNTLDLVSATDADELERQIGKAIHYRQEIEQERDRARLARWNNDKEETK